MRSAWIDGRAIHGNSATGSRAGEAVYVGLHAEIPLVNCELVDNSASYGGALYASGHELLQLLACTVARNSAAAFLGALEVNDLTVIQGCIVWSNGFSTDGPLSGGPGHHNATRSCIEGGWNGLGNIAQDPLFVDSAAEDYRIRAGSPCIDASRNGLLPFDDPSDLDQDGLLLEELPLDIAGLLRRVDDPGTADTGSGRAPVLDMGAHEFHP